MRALREDLLVLTPTETVYGLAGDARSDHAVAAIYAAKDRPQFNPLIAHVADLEAALRIAAFDDRALRLAEAFWPGPLTLVAPARAGGVCDLARAGLDTVAVRSPAHPVAMALLKAFNGPLAAPSANRSGRPSPTTLVAAMDELGDKAAVALEGGACAVGLESTVVSLLEGPPRLLRPGAVTREALVEILGPLADAGADARRSPGRLARHYAPQAPVRLGAEGPGPGEVFLAFGPSDQGPAVMNLSPSGDLAEAAANLFAFLRAADARAPVGIAVADIPGDGLGEAIRDRLARAAGKVG